jgi:hypothetical protein
LILDKKAKQSANIHDFGLTDSLETETTFSFAYRNETAPHTNIANSKLWQGFYILKPIFFDGIYQHKE